MPATSSARSGPTCRTTSSSTAPAPGPRQHDNRVVLVFDGKAPGGVVGETELDGRTTLVGSGHESADEWLIREAPHYRHPWLVTSDRALRAAAGGEAERVIGGGSFLRELAG